MLSCRPRAGASGPRRRAAAAVVRAAKSELRICQGKVCTKQGSKALLKFAQDLGLHELEVNPCGCLGNCGNGPNIVLLPQEVVLHHVATPTDVAEVLRWQLRLEVPPALLKATELRLAGNALAVDGDLAGAIAKYNQALELRAGRGEHMVQANLSAAHLQLGDKQAALAAAEAAVACAPPGFHMAAIRQVDALYALGRFEEAAAAVAAAVQRDAAFRAQPEYKVIVQALKKAGARSLVA